VTDVPEPVAAGLDTDGIEVRLLDLAGLDELGLVAASYLTESEAAEYAELRHPWRRREWLGARVCLKRMVIRQGRVDDPRRCAVVKDPRGRPRLVFAPDGRAAVVEDCSLSHKGRLVCAATASAVGSRIGVDLEEVSPRLRRLAERFAHDRDTLLGSRPVEERLAILWALKEACSKVVGRGLAMAFRGVTVEEIAPGRHRVATDALALAGRHTVRDGYVVALCVGTDLSIDR
jgi:phosphopantetheinyl transferase